MSRGRRGHELSWGRGQLLKNSCWLKLILFPSLAMLPSTCLQLYHPLQFHLLLEHRSRRKKCIQNAVRPYIVYDLYSCLRRYRTYLRIQLINRSILYTVFPPLCASYCRGGGGGGYSACLTSNGHHCRNAKLTLWQVLKYFCRRLCLALHSLILLRSIDLEQNNFLFFASNSLVL